MDRVHGLMITKQHYLIQCSADLCFLTLAASPPHTMTGLTVGPEATREDILLSEALPSVGAMLDELALKMRC